MEIYFFVDPFCTKCWSLTPIIKKLQIEYGKYFSLRYILAGKLMSWNRNLQDIIELKQQSIRQNNMQRRNRLESLSHLAAISIKAAELQGKRAGMRFIQRLQELLFVENENICDVNTLQECAKYIGLDIREFLNDLYSESAANAFQCDLKISAEMEVDQIPAMVFFNENIEDEGIKVTGAYSYEIYVQILSEMYHGQPEPDEKPPLEQFLANNPINSTYELALIYDKSTNEMERILKELLLQQKVEKITTNNGDYWIYKYTNRS